MLELLTRSYFDKHPLEEISAARFMYSFLSYENMEEMAAEIAEEQGLLDASDKAIKHQIEQENDLNEVIRWCRKETFPIACRMTAVKKLLEKEDEAYPIMQKRIMTNIYDHFIETAVRFFHMARKDPCEWILQDYQKVRSPYARSLLLMILGFRADLSAIPVLMAQVDWFEKTYPDESYDQGPLLALYEIKARLEEKK